jgi:hypothetical protein
VIQASGLPGVLLGMLGDGPAIRASWSARY